MADAQKGGEVLGHLRHQNGLSVSELARRAKVSATTVINYERGMRPNGDEFTPNPTVLLKVASVFPPRDAAHLLATFGVEERGHVLAGSPEGSGIPNADYATGSQFEFMGRAANDPRKLVFRDPNGEIVILYDEQGQ